MAYSLTILPRAEDDFAEMYHYIAQRSFEGAESWKSAFKLATARLRTNPSSCGLAPEDFKFDFELRQLLFKTKYGLTYRAVFRIEDEHVFILRLCGPGQAPLTPDEVPFL